MGFDDLKLMKSRDSEWIENVFYGTTVCTGMAVSSGYVMVE